MSSGLLRRYIDIINEGVGSKGFKNSEVDDLNLSDMDYDMMELGVDIGDVSRIKDAYLDSERTLELLRRELNIPRDKFAHILRLLDRNK